MHLENGKIYFIYGMSVFSSSESKRLKKVKVVFMMSYLMSESWHSG